MGQTFRTFPQSTAVLINVFDGKKYPQILCSQFPFLWWWSQGARTFHESKGNACHTRGQRVAGLPVTANTRSFKVMACHLLPSKDRGSGTAPGMCHGQSISLSTVTQSPKVTRDGRILIPRQPGGWWEITYLEWLNSLIISSKSY